MAITQTSPQIDPAERSDRFFRQDRQRDEGHRQQHQTRAQFRPGDLLHPAVQLLPQREQPRGGDRDPGGDPHVAEDRIGAERKGQHAGHRGGGGEAPGGRVLVAAEDGDDDAISGERRAEDDRPAEARGPAGGLRQNGDQAAEQPRDCKSADARGATARPRPARAPAPLQPDQQADAEGKRKAGDQVLQVHERSGRHIRMVLEQDTEKLQSFRTRSCARTNASIEIAINLERLPQA